MLRSIRTRLILGFVVLAVLPLLIVGVVFALMGTSNLRASSIAAQQQEAAQVSEQVDSLLTDTIQRMQMLINVDGIGSVALPQQQTLINVLMSYDHALDGLSLLNTNGMEVVRVARRDVLAQSDLRDESQDASFKVPVQTNQPYFSNVEIDPTTGEPIITVALPLHDLQSGALSGILVGDIRFRPVWDLIATISANQTDTIYIVDSSDRVVAARDPGTALKGTTAALPSEAGETTGLAGNDVILAFANLQFGSQIFKVVAEKPTTEAFSLAINQNFVLFVIIVLALAAAIILSVVTIQLLVRPVLQLAATADAISRGEFNRQVPVQSHDEIGMLERAFNSMTTRLVQTMDGLRNNVTELEKVTHERETLIGELQEASRLKNEFLSTMSHELRTPLNAINGFSGILLSGIGGAIDDEARHMIERIETNAKRLRGLIDDILDISRIEAGRSEIHETPVSLTQLADQWQNQIDVLAQQKGLSFTCTVDKALPDKVLLDGDKVTQVAINLLSNAIKFTEQGAVALTVNQQSGMIQIAVVDTGVGIPPHALEYIFDEFRQVDGTSSRAYGGNGLGLAIARKLCRLMNGNLTVKSTLGQGSTFTAQIPLKLPSVTLPTNSLVPASTLSTGPSLVPHTAIKA